MGLPQEIRHDFPLVTLKYISVRSKRVAPQYGALPPSTRWNACARRGTRAFAHPTGGSVGCAKHPDRRFAPSGHRLRVRTASIALRRSFGVGGPAGWHLRMTGRGESSLNAAAITQIALAPLLALSSLLFRDRAPAP